MATQVICDECGEVIDQTQPHWSVQGTKVQLDVNGSLTVVEEQQHFDYHEGCLPREKLEEITNPPVEPPVDPDAHPDQELPEPEDPYPGVVISDMTIQQALAWADDDVDKIEWAITQEEAGQNRRSLVDQLNNKLG